MWKSHIWYSVRLPQQLTRQEEDDLLPIILNMKIKDLLRYSGKMTQKKGKPFPVKKIKLDRDLYLMLKGLDINIRKLIMDTVLRNS